MIKPAFECQYCGCVMPNDPKNKQAHRCSPYALLNKRTEPYREEEKVITVKEYEDLLLRIENIKADLTTVSKNITDAFEKIFLMKKPCEHPASVTIGGAPQCSECGKAF